MFGKEHSIETKALISDKVSKPIFVFDLLLKE